VRTTIEVKSKVEGAHIARGIGDPVTRATAIVTGVLLDLLPAQRERVLRNTNEALKDAAEGDFR